MNKASLLLLLYALLATTSLAGQSATSGRITGMVADGSTARPLASATVTVEGTQVGTITGPDGRFVLTNVPAGVHTVHASLIGHGSQSQRVTVVAGEATAVNFTLETQAVLLEGLVAVGYGTQSRRDVTGSVASVRAEEIRQVPTSNAIIALKGKVPGVDITQDGYAPGAGMRVRIRGARSLRASNEPLYVVDGIPLSGGIQDFNPADIQAIEVLKDASATAIYGSRGANGVVMITTNRGRRAGTQFSVESRYGRTDALNRVDLMDGPTFAQYKRDAFRAAGRYECPEGVLQCAAGDEALFRDPADQYFFQQGRWTDWQDLMLRRGTEQSHQFNVSGGDERTRFSLGGEYHDEVGIVRAQDFERKSIRGSIEHEAGRARLGLSTHLVNSTQNLSSGGRLIGLTHGNNPLAAAFDADGKPIFNFDQDPLTRNPLNDAMNQIDERDRIRAFGSVFGELTLAEGISLQSQFGPDFSVQRRGLFIGAETRELLGSAGSAQAETWEERRLSYTLSNFLTINRQLGSTQRMQATLLYEIQQERFEDLGSGRARQLPYEHQRFWNVGSASTAGTPWSRLRERALQSYMSRVNYQLLDRYMFTVTGRYDGSSVLADGNKYAFFPSAAVAWRLGDEAFMARVPALSDLKLRASWGRTGNSAIDPYGTQGALTRTGYNFGNELAFGYRPGEIENPGLMWERTTQLDFGVDFGLFGNQVTGSLDFYRADTDDLLMQRQLPITSGFGSVLENIGETRNSGVELALSTINLSGANGFRWSTDFNFARNKNEIISLYGGKEDDIGNRWFIGKPIHDCENPATRQNCRYEVFYDFQFAGIWQIGEEAEAARFNAKPGQIRVRDQNGDGVINDLDRVYLGDMYPDWTAGLTNRMEYRNFDLSVSAAARMGVKIFNGIGSIQTGRYNMLDLAYWTPERPSSRYPQPNIAQEVIPYHSTLWYEDGSNIRVRNITLGYNLPEGMSRRWGAERARVYFVAHDPFLFTDYQGYDPENATTANTPSSRKLMLGVNLGF
jgi:TonB-linked SusC/RagA family outer membrane protein